MSNLLLLARAYGRGRNGVVREFRAYIHRPNYEPGKAILVDVSDVQRQLNRIDVLSIEVVRPPGWGVRSASSSLAEAAVPSFPGHRFLTRQESAVDVIAEPLQGWFES